MAQTIKLKRSAVSGSAPDITDLELGEVAINTYDGKMYIKKDDGTESIVEISGGGGGASVTVSDSAPSSPGAGDLWWDSTTGTLKIYYSDANSDQWVEAVNVSDVLFGIDAIDGNTTTIQLLRDTEANRTSTTPVSSELFYATDTKKLYIGDGSTAGGVEVGGGASYASLLKFGI